MDHPLVQESQCGFGFRLRKLGGCARSLQRTRLSFPASTS